MKRFFRWVGSMALAVAVGGAFLAWQGYLPVARGRTPEAEAQPASARPAERRLAPVAVTVAPVTARTVQRRVQVVGTLYGIEEIEVSAKVAGRVARILHEVGDVVRPGDVLLEVDPTDLQLAATEAARSLELELARLGLTEVPAAGFDVSRLPGVERARLLEKNARSKYDRSQALLKRQALSPQDLEQTENDFEVARVGTRQAVLEAESSIAAIRHRQALLETLQQKVRDARLVVPTPSRSDERVAARVVHASAVRHEHAAPEFVIAARLISEGEMVNDSPATNLFRLVMDRPLKLKANVPERHAGEIRVGQHVDVSVEAWPGETFAGTVARVNPTVDRENRTFEIEVGIPNAERRLRPGSFSKASVLTRAETGVSTIPEEALVKFAGVVKVFVVRDGAARAVPVETGARMESDVAGRVRNWEEARGDFQPGDLVVTSGHSQLAEGTPVRIREETAPSR